MPEGNEVDEKVIWSDDLAAVLEAASEASQVPLMWLANQDFSPEQTKAWLCEAVDATVEEGAFSGSLHQVAEEGTGHVVAFTGCGPKSAANAKFLIGCAHFILKHRDSLSDHAATVAELRAEVERLRADAYKFRRLARLLDGFDFRLGRNVLMPPATYLDSVEITCEFQPGVGQSVIDAIMDTLTGADPT